MCAGFLRPFRMFSEHQALGLVKILAEADRIFKTVDQRFIVIILRRGKIALLEGCDCHAAERKSIILFLVNGLPEPFLGGIRLLLLDKEVADIGIEEEEFLRRIVLQQILKELQTVLKVAAFLLL